MVLNLYVASKINSANILDLESIDAPMYMNGSADLV